MSYELFLADFPSIKTRSAYSLKKLSIIRKKIKSALKSSKYAKKICIVTNGSFARLEASESSDLDYFIITDEDTDKKEIPPELKTTIQNIIDTEVGKLSGNTGTFGADSIISLPGLLKNIGGGNDTNKNLTRRMLFLLEGEWIFNKNKFQFYREELIKTYIKEDIAPHKINIFLLNDIIRYYRTIATDFEFKVSEGGKNWGLRNIKLRFSRKLLFFSGIIVAAETCHQSRTKKIQRTLELFDLTPLERIFHLSNIPPKNIFKYYETFLDKISDPETRTALDSVKKTTRYSNEEFMNIRGLGQDFSWCLHKWLTENYFTAHPIHHLLIF